jgi:hypothetical protein
MRKQLKSLMKLRYYLKQQSEKGGSSLDTFQYGEFSQLREILLILIVTLAAKKKTINDLSRNVNLLE